MPRNILPATKNKLAPQKTITKKPTQTPNYHYIERLNGKSVNGNSEQALLESYTENDRKDYEAAKYALLQASRENNASNQPQPSMVVTSKNTTNTINNIYITNTVHNYSVPSYNVSTQAILNPKKAIPNNGTQTFVPLPELGLNNSYQEQGSVNKSYYTPEFGRKLDDVMRCGLNAGQTRELLTQNPNFFNPVTPSQNQSNNKNLTSNTEENPRDSLADLMLKFGDKDEVSSANAAMTLSNFSQNKSEKSQVSNDTILSIPGNSLKEPTATSSASNAGTTTTNNTQTFPNKDYTIPTATLFSDQNNYINEKSEGANLFPTLSAASAENLLPSIKSLFPTLSAASAENQLPNIRELLPMEFSDSTSPKFHNTNLLIGELPSFINEGE